MLSYCDDIIDSFLLELRSLELMLAFNVLPRLCRTFALFSIWSLLSISIILILSCSLNGSYTNLKLQKTSTLPILTLISWSDRIRDSNSWICGSVLIRILSAFIIFMFFLPELTVAVIPLFWSFILIFISEFFRPPTSVSKLCCDILYEEMCLLLKGYYLRFDLVWGFKLSFDLYFDNFEVLGSRFYLILSVCKDGCGSDFLYGPALSLLNKAGNFLAPLDDDEMPPNYPRLAYPPKYNGGIFFTDGILDINPMAGLWSDYFYLCRWVFY